MFQRGKWAFLTDYVRLKIVYEHGGIYLDTDVQLIRSLDPLVEHGAYMGVENTSRVATGLGFAAEAGHPFIRENMEYYEQLASFEELQSCPWITTSLLEKHGYREDCIEIQTVAGMTIYPEEYLCPKNERTGITKVTKNTFSIHQFDASWFEESWKEGQKKRWREVKLNRRKHSLYKTIIRLIGVKTYQNIKKRICSR